MGSEMCIRDRLSAEEVRAMDCVKPAPNDLDIALSPNIHPPIEPLSALILFAIKSPLSCAAEAVIVPSENNFRVPAELLIEVGSIEKPPMTPEPVALILSAVNLPCIKAFEAVSCPVEPVIENTFPSLADNLPVFKFNPPMFPALALIVPAKSAPTAVSIPPLVKLKDPAEI